MQAQFQIFFHLLNAHPAFFQASKIFDPFYIFLIENPAVAVVALDVWDQPLVAVEFQSLVGHIQFPADLHHCIQGGCENQLRGHTAGNFGVGNGKEKLYSVVEQCMPYIGYPRSLNAMSIIDEIAAKEK